MNGGISRVSIFTRHLIFNSRKLSVVNFIRLHLNVENWSKTSNWQLAALLLTIEVIFLTIHFAAYNKKKRKWQWNWTAEKMFLDSSQKRQLNWSLNRFQLKWKQRREKKMCRAKIWFGVVKDFPLNTILFLRFSAVKCRANWIKMRKRRSFDKKPSARR